MRASSSSNTRWCPTPEQLMVLEELYRRGLRTPNAPQIQKITAHLSLYGNIQGKNVFYWFQNHKARDRQRLRKKHHQLQLHHFHRPAPAYPFHPSPQNIPFQGEEVRGGVMRQEQQTWRRWSDDNRDPPKDCLMRATYGHDSVMIMDVGPAIQQPPLETLELFPLSASPTSTAAECRSSSPKLRATSIPLDD